jgi:uncharacterized protein YbaA (DUF1428 family)
MVYVDGFVIPVSKKNIQAYQKMSKQAGKIWKKHGAIQYIECAGDDLKPNVGKMKMKTFSQIAKTKPTETVVFSFIIYKSRAHRDKVNAKVMKDPDMANYMGPDLMPFDMKRMAYGGFKSIVEI